MMGTPSEILHMVNQGGVIGLLVIVLFVLTYGVINLFKRLEDSHGVFTKIESIEKRSLDVQDKIVNEMKLSNTLSQAQLESASKIHDLYVGVIGTKMDSLDKGVSEIKEDIRSIKARFKNKQENTINLRSSSNI
ncbi:hypothetical protein [Campylobacter fetus]|uniref:hypothetical protein n=1 Tax=Campylobacter fetus TaxID=196 RepID=UPI000FC99622|nr:hypothetical protein [Campylobacter fetus]RUT50990.1 hypothetical protein BWK67_00255 [Campylobacter fetus]RUT51718.1 hypothetical protein BWK51_00255 [Campylobacter fetus]